MMVSYAQFIVASNTVECPACGTLLTLQSKQGDRVYIMHHAGSALCSLYNHRYRVDRLNGHAEEYHDA